MKGWWKPLLRYAPAEAAGLTLIGLLTAIGVGLSALKPLPMKFLVDDVLAGKSLPPGLAEVADWLGAAGAASQAAMLVVATVLVLITGSLAGRPPASNDGPSSASTGRRARRAKRKTRRPRQHFALNRPWDEASLKTRETPQPWQAGLFFQNEEPQASRDVTGHGHIWMSGGNHPGVRLSMIV